VFKTSILLNKDKVKLFIWLYSHPSGNDFSKENSGYTSGLTQARGNSPVTKFYRATEGFEVQNQNEDSINKFNFFSKGLLKTNSFKTTNSYAVKKLLLNNYTNKSLTPSLYNVYKMKSFLYQFYTALENKIVTNNKSLTLELKERLSGFDLNLRFTLFLKYEFSTKANKLYKAISNHYNSILTLKAKGQELYLIHYVLLLFFFRDVNMFLNYFTMLFKKKDYRLHVFSLVNYLMKAMFFAKFFIMGLRFQIKGKFNKNPRKRKIIIEYGYISKKDRNFILKEATKTVNSRAGSFGFKF
jgi:hypothetical protein